MAGLAALGLVGTFWTASVVVELVGDRDLIATTKQAIAWGLLLLVPAVMTTNATGFRELRRRTPRGRAVPRLLARKLRRGVAVAILGVTVLVPCALWLAWTTADPGPLTGTFHVVQAIELAVGAVNLVLLSLNARDGFRMRPARAAMRPDAATAAASQ
jgi:hypothetical protein